MRRQVWRFGPELVALEVIVQPPGAVGTPVELVIITNIRSFSWVLAGVSRAMAAPLSTVLVVAARSLIGVVFFSVAVAVQLGVVDGFSVSWCVAPMSLPHVAVTVPVGPAGSVVVA